MIVLMCFSVYQHLFKPELVIFNNCLIYKEQLVETPVWIWMLKTNLKVYKC